MASRGTHAVTIPADTTIGQAIRQRRTELGIGIRELARQSRFTHGYISLIEAGKRTPPRRTIELIFVALAELEAAKKTVAA